MVEYKIIYAPGSGVTFLSALVTLYLVGRSNLLHINDIGVPMLHPHTVRGPQLFKVSKTHDINFKNYEAANNVVTIGISYNDNDIKTMAVLNYQKFIRPTFADPSLLANMYQTSDDKNFVNMIANFTEAERQQHFSGSNDFWGIKKSTTTFDHTIEFKTLLNDPNKTNTTVANFLNKPIMHKLHPVIVDWQLKSKNLLNDSR